MERGGDEVEWVGEAQLGGLVGGEQGREEEEGERGEEGVDAHGDFDGRLLVTQNFAWIQTKKDIVIGTSAAHLTNIKYYVFIQSKTLSLVFT